MYKGLVDEPLPKSFDPSMLRDAMVRRLYRRSMAEGQIVVPAVPGMIDEYVQIVRQPLRHAGRRVHARTIHSAQEGAGGRAGEGLQGLPALGHRHLVSASLRNRPELPVKAEWRTVEADYDNWVATRPPPLFGTEPDARVLALAGEAADPTTYRVLDIGAGTGRNALALARRGHPVDAVEIAPKFADVMRSEVEGESLGVRVIQSDVFTAMEGVHDEYQLMVLSEVVPDFRTTHELRGVFELATECLAPGGRLVFNTFLARPGYTPDSAARELGQQCNTMIFTRDEVTGAAAELPLELIADDSAYEYEKAHLPEGAWPPTGWFEGWTSGLDVFDVAREESPIELRWLVYQKSG